MKRPKQITIYGEHWCPYCRQAKQLAKKLKIKTKFISGKSGDYIKNELKLKKTPTTIPQISIDGKYIGGFSKLSTMFNKYL
jgi:glutaredoxin 3